MTYVIISTFIWYTGITSYAHTLGLCQVANTLGQCSLMWKPHPEEGQKGWWFTGWLCAEGWPYLPDPLFAEAAVVSGARDKARIQVAVTAPAIWSGRSRVYVASRSLPTPQDGEDFGMPIRGEGTGEARVREAWRTTTLVSVSRFTGLHKFGLIDVGLANQGVASAAGQSSCGSTLSHNRIEQFLRGLALGSCAAC